MWFIEALLSGLLQAFCMVALPLLTLAAFCLVRDAHRAVHGRFRRRS